MTEVSAIIFKIADYPEMIFQTNCDVSALVSKLHAQKSNIQVALGGNLTPTHCNDPVTLSSAMSPVTVLLSQQSPDSGFAF